MDTKTARRFIKNNYGELCTKRTPSGRLSFVNRRSKIEKCVTNAIERNKVDLLNAYMVYIESELIKVQPLELPALKRALNATSPRNKKIYGSRYDRIVDRVSLFSSLKKDIEEHFKQTKI